MKNLLAGVTLISLLLLGCSSDEASIEHSTDLVTKQVSTEEDYTETLALKKSIYEIAKKGMNEFNATNVLVGIVDSKSGGVIAMVDTLHYLNNSDTPYDNTVLEYSYEPGSVISPIVYALALEKGKVTPQSSLDGHNGKYLLGNKTITDAYKFEKFSAEDAIVYSSNIGAAQLGLSLESMSLYEGLNKFSLFEPSMSQGDNEAVSKKPNMQKLEIDIYKATISYGYGIKVNLTQLLRAYSVFNNDGVINSLILQGYDNEYTESQRVISKETAASVQKALRRVVKVGTGREAYVKGLSISGKTGTAHMTENGRYIEKYNSSFIGFYNQQDKHYTIGITVINPQTTFYTSKTAVPLFKHLVHLISLQ